MLVSFDVGIKNMAFCVIDKKNKNIVQWESIDMTNSKKTQKQTCHLCKRIAKFTRCGELFCSTHMKKTDPSALILHKASEKKKIQAELSSRGILDVDYEKHYFTSLQQQKANCQTISLIEIGRNIKKKLDELLPSIELFTDIIIENQISPIATRMKTIQGMLVQYFIMRQHEVNIEFVSSSNKLKGFGKLTYNQRKKKSIEIVQKMIIDDSHNFRKFENSDKKDDLADCYLQGYCWLEK